MEEDVEAPKSQVIRTNDELCRFLLPDSPNSQTLSGKDLSWEVDIVGVKANRNPERFIQTRIRQLVDAKVQKDSEKYHLGEAEKTVLKELYAGFSQSMLQQDGQEFAVRITRADKTEWLPNENYPPHNLHVKDMEYLSFRNPESHELAHVNARGNESVMEQQAKMQILNVSPELFDALLKEFSRDALVEKENRQIRKSAENLFRFTALQLPKKISSANSTSQRTELFAVPIHRVGQYKNY